MNNELLESCTEDINKSRIEALKNAKNVLEEAFPEKYNATFIQKFKEARPAVFADEEEFESKFKISSEDVSEAEDVDDQWNDWNEDVKEGPEEEKKNPSFFQNLFDSFHRNKINQRHSMICRFQKLAGINVPKPLAILTIGENEFQLSKIPPWYDIIRFKVCGFKYETITPCK